MTSKHLSPYLWRLLDNNHQMWLQIVWTTTALKLDALFTEAFAIHQFTLAQIIRYRSYKETSERFQLSQCIWEWPTCSSRPGWWRWRWRRPRSCPPRPLLPPRSRWRPAWWRSRWTSGWGWSLSPCRRWRHCSWGRAAVRVSWCRDSPPPRGSGPRTLPKRGQNDL